MEQEKRIEPSEFKRLLDFVYSAHQEHNTNKDFRQNGKVPFLVHPLWCALMLLNDQRIPYEERYIGYQALLLHDVKEDTNLPIPDWVDKKVAALVDEMTHETWEENLKTKGMSSFVKLLTLVDKLATLYDEAMRPDPARRKQWKGLVEKLLEDVRKTYGADSRIVTTAKATLETTDW